MKKSDTSLFMGRSMYTGGLVWMPGENMMLTQGGARGGKGACASIPNLLTWPHSVLVLDIKGTHARVTARYRREVLKQKVFCIDPYRIVVGQSARFDPLATLRKNNLNLRDLRERIAIISDALVLMSPAVKDPHWDESAKALLTGLIAHMLTSNEFNEPSLCTLRHLLTLEPHHQSYLWADMLLNERASRAPIDAAARIVRGLETNEILGILSNGDKHTDWLSYDAIQEVFAPDGPGEAFTFEELKKQPTTVYLIIPPEKLNIHARFLRLFVNLAINSISVNGRSKIPVLMLLDEFASLGYMAEVVKAFRLLASFNLILWPFVQELGALKDLYKASADALIQNSRAVQVFAASDEASKKFASDHIGPRSMRNMRGVNSTSQQAPMLRTSSEVAKEISAESDCQYILRAGHAPLYLKKVRYYEDRLRWKADSNLPDWIMRKWYPFYGKYDNDPDFS